MPTNDIFLVLLFTSCSVKQEDSLNNLENPYLLVLGVAQDAGYPQISCQKECCRRVYKNPENKRLVSSIALIDPVSNESWLFDATPDFTEQTRTLSNYLQNKNLPDGIFLTHGHIGHYTGLMYLGREAMNAQSTPVYGMPRMKRYLSNNGPWSQLTSLKNIELKELKADSTITLNERISVTPIEVPHRDEFTETVGFVIQSHGKKTLFIPDIDKWEKWNRNIIEYIKEVDIALMDATFYSDGEIARDMSEVPHPFVEESIELFKDLSKEDRKKIYFIHFNHTNPLLIDESDAQKKVIAKGFNIAKQEQVLPFN